jgi:hypothetical protein
VVFDVDSYKNGYSSDRGEGSGFETTLPPKESISEQHTGGEIKLGSTISYP